MKLTILMPCLNEAETLALCINKANLWIARSGVESEILISDNGSLDGSQDIATSLGARVLLVKQKGYGSALFHGSVAAKGEFIIMGDSDNSYDFSQLDAFISKLDEGYDLVMGNRFLGGIAKDAMPWKNRYIGNPVLTWVGRKLFSCPVNDFHCGLRGFRRDAFHRMDLRTTGMEFASEMVIKAKLFGMQITEVPTSLSKDGRNRPPHLRPWRDGWRHLRFMLLFSPRWLFFIPGTLVFLFSLTAYTALLFGPVHVGNVTFDVHTLFYLQAGLLLGFLSTSMGVVIRTLGMREGLLQEHTLLNTLRTSPVLEIGGGVGILLIIGGGYWGLKSVILWSASGFGNLSQGILLRTVSFSTTMIMLGGITLLVSLVLGFLSLPTREHRLVEDPSV